MVDLDTREWLLTNGLGSFASGTVSDVRTRTYHGWLFAAQNPPTDRTLLLSHLEANLEVKGRLVELGTNFWRSGEIAPTGYQLLRCFESDPVPKWIWSEDDWQLTRLLVMPHYGEGGEVEKGRVGKLSPSSFCDRIFMKYRYEGKDVAILKLRLLIGERDFHHQQTAIPELQFVQMLGEQQVCLQAVVSGNYGIPWHLRWTKGEYNSDGFWYWNYALPEETQRGLGDREDLYSPGYLSVTLQPGDTVTLEARVGFPEQQSTLTSEIFTEVVEAEQERLRQIFTLGCGKQQNNYEADSSSVNFATPSYPHFLIWQKLLQAADQFIVYRASIDGSTVIAGYHWFNDRGRDTLIALPGLALIPQRFDLAKELLQTFGRYCCQGLIPNAFSDIDGEPLYNSIDTGLWWIESLGLYLEATHDWKFLAEQYPIVQQIYKAFIGGTRYNIQVDSTDGLVGWYASNVALTWMNVVIDGHPVTPRYGKPVEINALWYSALCWASRWAEILSEQETGNNSVRLAKQAQRYAQQAQQVKASLQKFWNPNLCYLYDTIEPDDRRNSQIRPNGVLALSLKHCGFSYQQGRQILMQACVSLLTPYGLRSLAPSDPEYMGVYSGNPEKRDRAYHQGTVWSWLLGPFIRAWERFYTEEPSPIDLQPLLEHFFSAACLGSISEIFDGDFPHTPKGAIAQALPLAEVIRHFDTSQSKHNGSGRI